MKADNSICPSSGNLFSEMQQLLLHLFFCISIQVPSFYLLSCSSFLPFFIFPYCKLFSLLQAPSCNRKGNSFHPVFSIHLAYSLYHYEFKDHEYNAMAVIIRTAIRSRLPHAIHETAGSRFGNPAFSSTTPISTEIMPRVA